MKEVERTPEAILARLAATAHIPISGGGDNVGGKYYGTVVDVGMSQIKFWHCESAWVERVRPGRTELEFEDGDTITEEEFFGEEHYPCSQHWQSRGDYDMAEFLVNAREDIAALLTLLGLTPPAIEPRDY